MPRTIADKRERWVWLETEPADPTAVTAAEANAGIRMECDLLSSDSRLSPTASDTINERAICESTNAQAPTNGNAEGRLAVFRDIDPDTGLPVASGDEVFAAVSTKGTRGWVLKSKGPLYTEDFAADHPYSLYEVVTDEPQEPSDRGGYIKDVVPLLVQDFWTHKRIAAGV
jgi:hypothetical protein